MNIKKILGILTIGSGIILGSVYAVFATEVSVDYMYSGNGSKSDTETVSTVSGPAVTAPPRTTTTNNAHSIKGVLVGVSQPVKRFDVGVEYGSGGDMHLGEVKAGYRLVDGKHWIIRPGLSWLNLKATDDGDFKADHFVLGVDLSYQIGRLTLKGGAGYGLGDSKQHQAISYTDAYTGTSEATVEWPVDFWDYRLALQYQLRENLWFNLGYRGYLYDADATSGYSTTFESDTYNISNGHTLDRKFGFATAGLIYRFGGATEATEAKTPNVASPEAKLTLAQITPDEGDNNTTVPAEITGSGFAAGQTVALTGAAQTRIAGQDVVVVSPDKIQCNFDLHGRPDGKYDLTVTGTDGQKAVAQQAFTVHSVPVTAAAPQNEPKPKEPARSEPSQTELKPKEPARSEPPQTELKPKEPTGSEPPQMELEPKEPAAAQEPQKAAVATDIPPVVLDVQKLNQQLEPVYFDFNRAVLRQDQLAKVEACLELLRQYPELQVRIGGHADARGQNVYNLKLSRLRAEAVRDYLLVKGIVAGRIELAAYGEEHPAVAGRGEAVWRQNRRVELQVSDQ